MNISVESKCFSYRDVNGILLDKDGTLTDAHVYWSCIIKKRALACIKNLKLSPDLFPSICNSLGLDLSTNRLLEVGPIAIASREQVAERLYLHFRSLNVNVSSEDILSIFVDVSKSISRDELIRNVILIDGAHEFLLKLRDLEVPLALVTSDSTDNTNFVLNHLGISSFFSSVICGDSGLGEKRFGQPAIEACNQLTIDPLTAISIGDAPMDHEMALAACLKGSILVASGQISFASLKRTGSHVVESLSNLIVENSQ